MAKKRGGIGATGSAKARFFHPSKNIRDRWLNQHTSMRLRDVVLVGKGTHRVNRKEQLCYECHILDIDDGTIFHIVCGNFKVEVAASTPFEDEQPVDNADDVTVLQRRQEAECVRELRTAERDVV